MMKKCLSCLLVMAMLCSLFGCTGEIRPGVTPGGRPNGGNGDGTGDNYVPPVMNDDPTDDFVVTLKADGLSYSPRMEMFAYWSDGFSIYTSRFDENGVARIDGLDGDYRVTLSAVPNEYTYDPNTNIATNDNRSIVVDLYTVNMLAGGGTGLYDCYSFRKTGVYCATINSADDAIYFQYAPDGMGTYSIESWMDTTADNVNPYVDVYGGSSQYKFFMQTIDDGGPVGSYTINFVHEVQIAAENISTGGQAVFTFVVKAETKNDKYPVVITFAVKRNGDFELPEHLGGSGDGGKGMIAPTYDFNYFDATAHEYGANYSIAYPEYQFGSTSTYVFDESRVKLWERSDGGDDFYHLYDEVAYAATDGYGPILYANITTKNRFIDRAFTQIEYDSSGNVVYNNLRDYKHLIEGVSATGRPGHYYCVSTCTCHGNATTGWACLEGCATCRPECTPCAPELLNFEGYQAYVNSDGMVPVTEDIRNFLLAYCQKQTFFYDGKGTLEDRPVGGKYFQAVGDSGWLFGCAYYREK